MYKEHFLEMISTMYLSDAFDKIRGILKLHFTQNSIENMLKNKHETIYTKLINY